MTLRKTGSEGGSGSTWAGGAAGLVLPGCEAAGDGGAAGALATGAGDWAGATGAAAAGVGVAGGAAVVIAVVMAVETT